MRDAWHLQNFDWFKSLPDGDLEALRNASVKWTYRPGEMIFAPSPDPQSVYLLELGVARIYRLSESGREITFGFVSPGEIFGEFAAFGDYPRESFAEAAETSSVLKIRKGIFQQVVSENPQLVIEVARQIGGRFKSIESRVENLVFNRVRTRLAKILVELGEDFGSPDADGVVVDISLTQSDLATLVGATRQSVNSTLQEFEKEGLIAMRGRRIVLIDPESLLNDSVHPDRS